MSDWRQIYKEKLMTPEQAAARIHSGDRIYFAVVDSVADVLTNALWERRHELEDITLISSFAIRPVNPYTHWEACGFRLCTPFQGPWERMARDKGMHVDFTTFHLSQFGLFFTQTGRPNVAFLEVSEPDENGNVSLSAGVGVHPHALESADRVFLQVNKQAPYITGADTCLFPISQAEAIIEVDNPLADLPEAPLSGATQTIADSIVELIPDGATIQLGLGSLSSAIGYGLKNRNDLGIHTEQFCPAMVELIKNGNVTNKHKGFMDGYSVFDCAVGTREMQRFMDHNPTLYGATFGFVNNPFHIAQNNRMMSINAAMAVDVYGQVAADAMGYEQYSACGGQVDFVRGAQMAHEGKSFIALESSFVKNGKRHSKIQLHLPEGTGVTTSRADVNYVVTEYGCVNLKALTMADRVRAMISLAHPDFRDELTEQARFHHLI